MSLADEEHTETDDEVCRVNGLSCRNDVLDCDVSRSTITRSNSNSNTTASVSQSSNQHSKSDATSNASYFSNGPSISSITNVDQPSNQKSTIHR